MTGKVEGILQEARQQGGAHLEGKFHEVMSNRAIPATAIARALTQAGYPVSATTIKDYRRSTHGGTAHTG